MAPSSSSSDLDASEEAGFLSNEPSAIRRPARARDLKLLVGTVLNGIFFAVSCVLFATWYYNTHFKLNAALRQASSYSELTFPRLRRPTKEHELTGGKAPSSTWSTST